MLPLPEAIPNVVGHASVGLYILHLKRSADFKGQLGEVVGVEKMTDLIVGEIVSVAVVDLERIPDIGQILLCHVVELAGRIGKTLEIGLGEQQHVVFLLDALGFDPNAGAATADII